MVTMETLREKRAEILTISAKYGVHHIRVFGSVANNAADEHSDVDFLVELEEERSLLDLGGLLIDLEKLLGCKVDVVTNKGLHWYIRDKVLEEARTI